MDTLLDIFDEIKENSSKNKKIEILKKHKHLHVLKDVLIATYDPFINYWIKKIPKYTNTKISGKGFIWALGRLKLLADRTYTGHAGIEWLKDTLEGVNSLNAIVIERIIKRDMRSGFSASTINKVWVGLIPEFKIMLAYPQDGKTVFNFPVMAQTKEDGMRCCIFVKNDEVRFFSRNGKPIQIFDHMKKEFLDISNGKDLVFDGELLVMKNGKVLDRKTGNGILNKAVKNTITKEESKYIITTLWDVIDYDEFFIGKSLIPAIERHVKLESLVYTVHSPYLSSGYPIRVIYNHIIDSQKELEVLYTNEIKLGHEGLIVKTIDGIWKNKKSRDWIKMKVDNELDLIVVDWEHGEGKYKKLLGALIVENRDGTLRVRVGGGYSDEDRKNIKPKNSIGEIITVRYNERITNKNSTMESLYLPRFIEFRLDKDEIDL